jgi:hypothetical protein
MKTMKKLWVMLLVGISAKLLATDPDPVVVALSDCFSNRVLVPNLNKVLKLEDPVQKAIVQSLASQQASGLLQKALDPLLKKTGGKAPNPLDIAQGFVNQVANYGPMRNEIKLFGLKLGSPGALIKQEPINSILMGIVLEGLQGIRISGCKLPWNNAPWLSKTYKFSGCVCNSVIPKTGKATRVEQVKKILCKVALTVAIIDGVTKKSGGQIKMTRQTIKKAVANFMSSRLKIDPSDPSIKDVVDNVIDSAYGACFQDLKEEIEAEDIANEQAGKTQSPTEERFDALFD